jgi:hypothetical protein
MHPTLWDFTRSPCAQPQARPNSTDRFSTGQSCGVLLNSLNGGGHCYVPSFVSGRNHVPFLGAFSQVCKLRERFHIATMIHTSQVCKLDSVSHNCNHQRSLLARETFFIMPSPTQMYFEFCLGWSYRHSLSTREPFFKLVKISTICSCVGRYCMCTIFIFIISLK